MHPIPASRRGFAVRLRPLLAVLFVLVFCVAVWVGVAYAAYTLII